MAIHVGCRKKKNHAIRICADSSEAFNPLDTTEDIHDKDPALAALFPQYGIKQVLICTPSLSIRTADLPSLY